MKTSFRGKGGLDGNDQAPGMARRTGRLVLAAAALAVTTMVATAGPAASAECTGPMLILRLCNSAPGSVTTPPTTAPPAPSIPPVTLPPVTVPPVTVPPLTATPPPAPGPDAARRLLDLVNGERRKGGLGQLASRDDITAIAVAHSERMVRAGDIFHSDTFFGPAVKTQLNAVARGENVAYNSDIDNAHARLMASPGHRANILDARFTTVGFGVVRHADGRYFVTQDFIQAAGAPRPPATAAAPARPPSAPRAAVARAAAPRPAATPPAPAPAPQTEAAPAAAVPETAPSFAVLRATDTPVTAVALRTKPVSDTDVAGPAPAAAVVLLAVAVAACWLVPRRRVG